MNTHNNQISFSITSITYILTATAIFLVLASIVGQSLRFVYNDDYLGKIVQLFYLDYERNIPTYFSMLIIFLAALILTFISMLEKKKGSQYVSRWITLAIGFLLMAADEGFQLHERLTNPFKNFFVQGEQGIFYFAWVIPGIVIVIFIGLFFYWFFAISAKASKA